MATYITNQVIALSTIGFDRLTQGAPTWSTTGGVTATKFTGDGSSLTNLPSLNYLSLSGGTITGGVTATKFTGDGSSLTNLNIPSLPSLNYFPLSGGTITGETKINANLTINGSISATGASYFANTFYSTTSALSVVNLGNTGPALYVGNNGTGDIASFYDLDQGVEVLHVGGSNGSFPNVGIKTNSPNESLTVVGNISASGNIYGNLSVGSGVVNFTTTTEAKGTPTIASSAVNLDLSTAALFAITLNSNVSASFINPPASPRVCTFTVAMSADGTTRAVTWPTTVKWAAGVPPTITSTIRKVDIFSFLTHDGGATYYGFTSDQNF